MTFEEAKAALGAYSKCAWGDIYFDDLKVFFVPSDGTAHQAGEHADPPNLTPDQLEALAVFIRGYGKEQHE